MKKVNRNKILSTHPITGEPIDVKWFRGASRYNNGATLYGRKYLLRYLVGRHQEELQGNGYSQYNNNSRP